tara:strand:+ start:358 stop:642 length:285 start_codon:yes stop_codon:yes gene_type:complete
MSVKEIHDLRQKVFYIDRGVTPYLNIQIMKLYELNSNLTTKVKELENKINNLSGENTSSVQSQINKSEEKTIEKKKRPTKKVEVTNDIRTITIE